MRILSAALILAASLPLVACSTVSLNDDIDDLIDWTPFVWTEPLADSSRLHTPYVVGASFRLWLHGNHENVQRWRVESSDENVATVGVGSGDERLVSFSAVVKKAGSATLRLVDESGDVHMERDIRVLQPDRIDLLPHGPLIIDGKADPEAHPLVLHGGTGTFMARYFAGGEQLSGNGALHVDAAPATGTTAEVLTTEFLEDRDWLQIHVGSTVGNDNLNLRVGGEVAKVWPFSVVGDDAIDHVELLGQDESNAHRDDALVVYAQAFNNAAAPIYGVEYDFTANGVAQNDATHAGDLYRYKFDATKPVMLEATHGQHVQGVMIKSGGGFVSSTNHVGCQAVPGAAGGDSKTSALVLLCFAALWIARRGTER